MGNDILDSRKLKTDTFVALAWNRYTADQVVDEVDSGLK